jgi:transposase
MNERKADPTDRTDDQWVHIRILLPRKRGKGDAPTHNRRERLNAIVDSVRTGSQWRRLPHAFPAGHTGYGFFGKRCQAGIWEDVNASLRTGVGQPPRREQDPSGVIFASQSVKTTETSGRAALTVASQSKDANRSWR